MGNLTAINPSLADYLSPFPFAAFGADGDDDDDDDEEDDDDDDDTTSTSKADPKDQRIADLSKESKKRRLALKAEKKRADDLEARLKAIEDKDKTEVERATTAQSEAEKRLQTLEPRLKEAERKLVFFESGLSAQFQNPAHALRLIDVSDIDDDDPEALSEAMKEKAEALLKESPYLKLAAGSSNGDSDDSKGDDKSGPPDTTTGSTSRGKKGKPDNNAALMNRFPALAGRGASLQSQ
jgi:hypothetical protein